MVDVKGEPVFYCLVSCITFLNCYVFFYDRAVPLTCCSHVQMLQVDFLTLCNMEVKNSATGRVVSIQFSVVLVRDDLQMTIMRRQKNYLICELQFKK